MNDEHRQELLRSSVAYATAKLSFANAIVIAQRAGETDEEIRARHRVHGADDPRRAPQFVGHEAKTKRSCVADSSSRV